MKEVKDYEMSDKELLENAEKSYITKEQLIEMIISLDFKQVKDLRIEVITGFSIKYDNDGKRFVNTFGYEIHLD